LWPERGPGYWRGYRPASRHLGQPRGDGRERLAGLAMSGLVLGRVPAVLAVLAVRAAEQAA
jgi:hypothetical protein